MTLSEKNKLDPTFARLVAAIDPDSSVLLSVQLRGALEYGIASGDIPANTRLPSVRGLAAHMNVSPVTVSNVYATLQDRGYIEGRVGSGTFVTERTKPTASHAQRMAAFEQQVVELIQAGQRLGLSRQDVAFRISMIPPTPINPIRILVLGTFLDATQSYATDLGQHLPPADQVTAATLKQAEQGKSPDADLVFCAHTLTANAADLFPNLPVVGMTLIPNEATRIALASLSPETKVGVVSYFDDYIPTFKTGIARFAPHVENVTVVPKDFKELPELLNQIDALVFATGTDYLCDALRPDQISFEYRHTPDTQAIRTELLPAIERTRTQIHALETKNEDH